MTTKSDLHARERRGEDRYDLDCQLVIQAHQRHDKSLTSRGKAINMSCKGLLFSSERSVDPGQRVEVSMAWPTRLADRCRLKLVVVGRVVRLMDGLTAITIEQAEYRTMGAEGLAA